MGRERDRSNRTIQHRPVLSAPHPQGTTREGSFQGRCGVSEVGCGGEPGTPWSFLLPQFLPRGREGKGQRQEVLRFGRESWAQAGIAPREVGRDGAP